LTGNLLSNVAVIVGDCELVGKRRHQALWTNLDASSQLLHVCLYSHLLPQLHPFIPQLHCFMPIELTSKAVHGLLPPYLAADCQLVSTTRRRLLIVRRPTLVVQRSACPRVSPTDASVVPTSTVAEGSRVT